MNSLHLSIEQKQTVVNETITALKNSIDRKNNNGKKNIHQISSLERHEILRWIEIAVNQVPFETDLSDNTLSTWITVTIPGDFDGDRDVDIFDIVMIADAYGSTRSDLTYNPTCDIDADGDIDIFDVVIAAGNYGESW